MLTIVHVKIIRITVINEMNYTIRKTSARK